MTYNFQGVLLPITFDLVTDETFQGMDAFAVAEMQGKEILPSFAGNEHPKTTFKSRDSKVKYKVLPDNEHNMSEDTNVDAPVEETPVTPEVE